MCKKNTKKNDFILKTAPYEWVAYRLGISKTQPDS